MEFRALDRAFRGSTDAEGFCSPADPRHGGEQVEDLADPAGRDGQGAQPVRQRRVRDTPGRRVEGPHQGDGRGNALRAGQLTGEQPVEGLRARGQYGDVQQRAQFGGVLGGQPAEERLPPSGVEAGEGAQYGPPLVLGARGARRGGDAQGPGRRAEELRGQRQIDRAARVVRELVRFEGGQLRPAPGQDQRRRPGGGAQHRPGAFEDPLGGLRVRGGPQEFVPDPSREVGGETSVGVSGREAVRPGVAQPQMGVQEHGRVQPVAGPGGRGLSDPAAQHGDRQIEEVSRGEVRDALLRCRVPGQFGERPPFRGVDERSEGVVVEEVLVGQVDQLAVVAEAVEPHRARPGAVEHQPGEEVAAGRTQDHGPVPVSGAFGKVVEGVLRIVELGVELAGARFEEVGPLLVLPVGDLRRRAGPGAVEGEGLGGPGAGLVGEAPSGVRHQQVPGLAELQQIPAVVLRQPLPQPGLRRHHLGLRQGGETGPPYVPVARPQGGPARRQLAYPGQSAFDLLVVQRLPGHGLIRHLRRSLP
ncbi:hypothetical protein ACWDR0_00005 [Streptomyces sp. NPDC003691]